MSILSNIKNFLFPERKIYKENTQRISETVRDINLEMSHTIARTQTLRKPDFLHKLVEDMNRRM